MSEELLMKTLEKKAVIICLNEKGVTKPCPRCSESSFEVVGETFIPLEEVGKQKRAIPCAFIACEACGFIMMHALTALLEEGGLMKYPPCERMTPPNVTVTPVVRMLELSWRRCGDCLPVEVDADYLVSDGFIVFTTEYLGSGKWGELEHEKIKYWLPLPLPPIEHQEE